MTSGAALKNGKRSYVVELIFNLLKFIARFWTEADKRVGDNIKYWR